MQFHSLDRVHYDKRGAEYLEKYVERVKDQLVAGGIDNVEAR